MHCSSCRQIERSLLLLLLFLLFQLILHRLYLSGGRVPSFAVESKQVHKQKENRFAGPTRLTKKSSGSGCVLEIARSPFGIFSRNDKQPSPSEELEESKSVQEIKGKGIF